MPKANWCAPLSDVVIGAEGRRVSERVLTEITAPSEKPPLTGIVRYLVDR
jgi:hypothetical protein